MYYKFHSPNKHLFDLLLDSCLWFSPARDFNDPFDLKFKLDVSIPKEVKIERLHRMMEHFTENGPYYLDKEKVTDEFLPRLENPEFDEKVKEYVLNEVQKLGICCFSKQFRNILMWSHYAEGHKGVCLGFDDFAINPNLNVAILPVDYSEEYPIVRDYSEAKVGLTTKSMNWKYEEEVRLINFSGIGKIQFKNEALKEVIFGAKTSTEDIDRIRKIIDSKNTSIKYRKAEIMKDKYQLRFRKLNS